MCVSVQFCSNAMFEGFHALQISSQGSERLTAIFWDVQAFEFLSKLAVIFVISYFHQRKLLSHSNVILWKFTPISFQISVESWTSCIVIRRSTTITRSWSIIWAMTPRSCKKRKNNLCYSKIFWAIIFGHVRLIIISKIQQNENGKCKTYFVRYSVAIWLH